MAIEITITVEDVDQADEIQALLKEAEEEGRLDFSFEVREEIVHER